MSTSATCVYVCLRDAPRATPHCTDWSFLRRTIRSSASWTTESGVDAPLVTPTLAGRSSGRKSLVVITSPSTVLCVIVLSSLMHEASLMWYAARPSCTGETRNGYRDIP